MSGNTSARGLEADYHMPAGMHRISDDLLDLRSDLEIDQAILHPHPPTDEKNIWFYWHQGYLQLHPYLQRNVRAWYRRLTRSGWAIRVVDRVPGSQQNVDKFLDVHSLEIFPQAYIDGTLAGQYRIQHCSDLVRFPLLLRYGGIYVDTGVLQIGDIDRMWNETLGNSQSPYDVLSYNCGGSEEYYLMNYFLASLKENVLIRKFHQLLLALWAADGGQLETTGMHKSPLVAGTPLTAPGIEYEDNGRKYSAREADEILTDYIIQGHAMRTVMSMVDPAAAWDGPQYTVDHVYAIEYMVGSQLINDLTDWNGIEAYRLMSLPLPTTGHAESSDQAKASNIVNQCLSRSFGFKLATGLILKMIGETLSSQWRRHEGSDDVPGTYAHWLRYGMLYWTHNDLPPRIEYKKIKPLRTGSLINSV